ncbi:patatin-like phospholipase family protein [Mongoliitalea daihaiensis]|uniref:patatin-like phospholipase family protein n=1 Tax=Mongoliitalea daihaiensis TaxID=2782006 RepID=UPI001F3246AF|nr:patatin-like phospholipase family protein [Mongoliitalea daihaiensis]UJP63300.1 patatin-like phospholipase family protein [Mongoliitalea daihaiensis]
MWDKFLYSFPVQLLFLHLKKNLLLLLFWFVLFLIIIQSFGTVLGIPFLFLDPEYLNEVSWQSFFIVGMALAIFTMAFQMTTYILDGARFKFLAVSNRPFLQFCLNNSIIPIIFHVIYLLSVYQFQQSNELGAQQAVWKLILGFLVGNLLTYIILLIYFGATNKDFFILFADSVEKRLRKTKLPRANMLRRIKETQQTQNKVLYYFDISFNFIPVRQDLSKFEAQKLLKVFDQNHLNLVIIQTVLISSIFLLSIFRENPYVQIPAAASTILLMAILTMMVGAISFWLRSWAIPAVLGALILFNYFSDIALFNRPHEAFGLDYKGEPLEYTMDQIRAHLHEDSVKEDKAYMIEVLNNWRAKFPINQQPKMVFIAVSGGGQRSALWTTHVLQQLQKQTDEKLFKHTHLITGASGGMIGAAFFRELYLRNQLKVDDPYLSAEFLDQIAADNLNPIIFSLLVNDLIFRTQYVEFNGNKYLKDRGFAFENQLSINTKGILNKPIADYQAPEREALIPLLPITPLITNDGRKLIISPTPMSYLAISDERLEGWNEKNQGIDFQRFFYKKDAMQLRFLSALRMGATFPFITPSVHLPTDPRMETMDAGLSDNFGIQDALKFMHVFRDWISQNTSGVVLVTIRDSEKFTEIKEKPNPKYLQKLFTPLQNIYVNWDNVQTLHNEALFTRFKEKATFPIQRIEFEYSTEEFLRERGLVDAGGDVPTNLRDIQRASLNWRLTSQEKKSILDNIYYPFNQASLRRVSEVPWIE